jgi:hypothetical protein
MQKRGVLVRDALPSEMKTWEPAITAALDRHGSDLGFQGRDATGRKSRVPWARLFSERKSPLATAGWYVVYLFHPDGSGVSLCLSHGSTTFEGGVYKARSKGEVARLMTWANAILQAELPPDPLLWAGVNLGGKGLAGKYESTTLFSKFYPAGGIPTDAELGNDLVVFAKLLARLYTADDEGRAPGASSPDVFDLLELVDEIASPLKRKGSGQGRNLSPEARRAIELCAMAAAKVWLEDQGFTKIKDVSRTDSCDYSAERDDQIWYIEVKGTTGGPGSVLLTRNEVALHRKSHPNNALLVMHGIQLSADRLSAHGGEMAARSPWLLDDERLSPVCYEYRLS